MAIRLPLVLAASIALGAVVLSSPAAESVRAVEPADLAIGAAAAPTGAAGLITTGAIVAGSVNRSSGSVAV